MIYIILFVFSKIIGFARSSENTQIEFCQWEPFVERSKHDCMYKCLTSYGFKHPITNSLTCYTLTSPVVSIIGHDSCECWSMLSTGTRIKCKPAIVYDKEHINECLETCPKLTAYISEQKNAYELVACEDSSKVEKLKLSVLISMRDALSSKSITNSDKCICKCGIGMRSDVQFTYTQRKYRGRSVGGGLAASCPQTMPYEGSVQCASRCRNMKGFLTRSQQLICFHLMTQAKVISKSKQPCECGHKTKKKGVREYCDPALTFETNVNNPQECELECAKNMIFRLKTIDRFSNIIWCGKKFESSKIIEDLEWEKDNTYNFEGEIADSSCICGIKEIPARQSGVDSVEDYTNDDDRTPAKFHSMNENRKTKEFAAYCSVGPFETGSKHICKKSCRRTKSYFTSNNSQNELICYDEIKEVIRIPSFVETGDLLIQDKATCLCGATFNANDKSRRYHQPCIPEIKFPLQKHQSTLKVARGQPIRCTRACRKHVAMVTYASPKYQVVRCESKTFSPKIYKQLDWKIINSTSTTNDDGKERTIYQCVCGLELSSLSSDDKSMHLNRNNDSTTLTHAKFGEQSSKENKSSYNHSASSPHPKFNDEMQHEVGEIEIHEDGNTNPDILLQAPSTSHAFLNTLLRDNDNSNYQSETDTTIPPTLFLNYENLERQNCLASTSRAINTDTNTNDGTSFPFAELNQNSRCGFEIQQETRNSSIDSFIRADKNIVLHETDPETYEAIEKNKDKFTEPVRDVDVPPKICQHELHVGESSKGKEFLLPDLNIPLQFPTQETNFTGSSDSECYINSPPTKRKRNLL